MTNGDQWSPCLSDGFPSYGGARSTARASDRPQDLEKQRTGLVQEQRFRREAEALARVRHPNVVRVYESGTLDGLPFIALELVSGVPLDRILANGTPRDRLLDCLEQVARGVHAAHEVGVVHRIREVILHLWRPDIGYSRDARTHPVAKGLETEWDELLRRTPRTVDVLREREGGRGSLLGKGVPRNSR